MSILYCVCRKKYTFIMPKIKIQFIGRIKYNNAKNAIVWLVKIQEIVRK